MSSFGTFDPAGDDGDVGPTDGLPTHERAYLIPGADAKGHHVRLYCRAMPGLGRLVSDILASRKYPFRTVGDVVRWCIWNGARRLAAGAGIKSTIAQVDTMIGVLQEEEYQQQFMEFFSALQRVVNQYVVDGASGEARRVVAQARASIDVMEESYWQERYMSKLMQGFGAFLEGTDAENAVTSWHHE